MPGDIDLEGSVGLAVEHLLITGQVHQPVIVGEDRSGPGFDDGDAAGSHTRPPFHLEN